MYPSVALVSCSGYQSAQSSLICNIADEMRRWQALYQDFNYYSPPTYFVPNPTNSFDKNLAKKVENLLKIKIGPSSTYLAVIREIEKNILFNESFKMDDSSLLVNVKSKVAEHSLIETLGSNGDESREHWGTEVRQSRSTRPTWEDKNNGTYKDAVVYGHMTDSRGRLNIKNEIYTIDQVTVPTKKITKDEENGSERGRETDEIKLIGENIENNICIKIQNLLLDLQSEYGKQVRLATTKKIRKVSHTDQLKIHLNLHHFLPPHRCVINTIFNEENYFDIFFSIVFFISSKFYLFFLMLS